MVSVGLISTKNANEEGHFHFKRTIVGRSCRIEEAQPMPWLPDNKKSHDMLELNSISTLHACSKTTILIIKTLRY